MTPPRNTYFIVFGLALSIIVLVIGLFIFLDDSIPRVRENSDKLIVATTIFPLADITRNIAGDNATVLQLLPVGADPHSYSITPQQLSDAHNAKTIFVIGHNLDTWASDAVTRATTIPVIVVDQGISLKEFDGEDEEHEGEEEDADEHEQGSIDPHYWLTVPNAQKIAATVASTLQELDPTHSDAYAENLKAYATELTQLEGELQTMSQHAPTKEFIAIHDAWSYLAENYGFELIATYEPVEGKEPSFADIQHLQELVQTHNIKNFYTEPVKHSLAATRFLRNELGLEIHELDDIGGVAPRDSYIHLMRENIRALSE